jgi:hypothetical protein
MRSLLPSDDYVCPDSNDDADVALRRRMMSGNSPMLLYIPLLCSPPHPKSQRRFGAVTLKYYNFFAPAPSLPLSPRDASAL